MSKWETNTPAIVLMGVSGSGKSTIGKRLAAALGATFIEGDDFHPATNIAKMRAGVSLDDADRWPWLNKLGDAIGAHRHGGRPVVAACSALRHSYRQALEQAALGSLTFIHLSIDPTSLEHRLRARHQHFMSPSLLASQLATLEPLRADEHGTTIQDSGTAERTVKEIERWLRLHKKAER